jgi:hypothetical protein
MDFLGKVFINMLSKTSKFPDNRRKANPIGYIPTYHFVHFFKSLHKMFFSEITSFDSMRTNRTQNSHWSEINSLALGTGH